jgi:hypothetical protein
MSGEKGEEKKKKKKKGKKRKNKEKPGTTDRGFAWEQLNTT